MYEAAIILSNKQLLQHTEKKETCAIIILHRAHRRRLQLRRGHGAYGCGPGKQGVAYAGVLWGVSDNT